MSVPKWYFDNNCFPPLLHSDNINLLTRFDYQNTYFPIFMPTYFDDHQPVWAFKKRIKFTYKLQLLGLMDWESIQTPTRTDPVLWDPFIPHSKNVDIRMLHGYWVLAPIWVHNRRILRTRLNPFKMQIELYLWKYTF